MNTFHFSDYKATLKDFSSGLHPFMFCSDKHLPQKVSTWVQQVEESFKNDFFSFNKLDDPSVDKNSLSNGNKFHKLKKNIFYLKEGEKKELQINYEEDSDLEKINLFSEIESLGEFFFNFPHSSNDIARSSERSQFKNSSSENKGSSNTAVLFPKVQSHPNFLKKSTGSFKKPIDGIIQNFIFLEKNSCFQLFENFCFKNNSILTLNYIFAQPSACLGLLKIDRSLLPHWNFTFCDLLESASLFSFNINSGSFSQYIDAHHKGVQSCSIIKGLHLLKEKEKTHQWVRSCFTGEKSLGRQICRSLLSGRSKNSVYSKATLQAQGVDSSQMLKNLILGSYAKAVHRPELEVYKDQVKAVHGSATGQPSPLEVFYMNSRGISKELALKFISKAWVNQIFQNEDLEDKLLLFQQEWNKRIQSATASFLDKKMNQMLSDTYF